MTLCLCTCVFTLQRYYVVGSNLTESAFRVLKIDRTEARELHIVDDQVGIIGLGDVRLPVTFYSVQRFKKRLRYVLKALVPPG